MGALGAFGAFSFFGAAGLAALGAAAFFGAAAFLGAATFFGAAGFLGAAAFLTAGFFWISQPRQRSEYSRFLFSGRGFLGQFQGTRVSCCGGENSGIKASLDCSFELDHVSNHVTTRMSLRMTSTTKGWGGKVLEHQSCLRLLCSCFGCIS